MLVTCITIFSSSCVPTNGKQKHTKAGKTTTSARLPPLALYGWIRSYHLPSNKRLIITTLDLTKAWLWWLSSRRFPSWNSHAKELRKVHARHIIVKYIISNVDCVFTTHSNNVHPAVCTWFIVLGTVFYFIFAILLESIYFSHLLPAKFKKKIIVSRTIITGGSSVAK